MIETQLADHMVMHGVPNAGDLCQGMDKIMYQRLMVIKVKHTGCVVTLFFVVGIQNTPSSKNDQVFVFICTHLSSIF